MTDKIVDPTDHKVAVLGLQGSGKTEYAKEIVRHHGLRALVFSPHRHDFVSEGDNFYYYKDFGPQHVEEFLKQAKALCKKDIIDLVFMDEMEMLYKHNFDVKDVSTDIFANHRHYGMGFLGITRRPQDIPSYFFESCKYVVSFALQGGNARRKFNELYEGMGDMILGLDYDTHEFVVKPIARPPEKFSAVELST